VRYGGADGMALPARVDIDMTLRSYLKTHHLAPAVNPSGPTWRTQRYREGEARSMHRGGSL
jgi:hypothetical protein